jgi:hypothetical protein
MGKCRAAGRSGTRRESGGGRWTERQGRETLAAWRESGLSASEFGRRHGISSQRLSWWRKRIGEWSGTQVIASEGRCEPHISFVAGEVRTSAAPSGAEPCSTVVRLPSGTSIEVIGSVSPVWVASLVSELRRQS